MTKRCFVLVAALVVLTTSAHARMPSQDIVDLTFPPLDNVTNAPPLDVFRSAWYARHLNAMGEFRLPRGQNETYRFLWLRTFHNPIAVRISCAEKSCDLIGRRLDGKGGYEPGVIAERTAATLTEQDTLRFRQFVEKSDFWQRATFESKGGADGAQWILEGWRDGRYHLVDLWSPDTTGPNAGYRELCLEMLRMASIPVQAYEIY